MGATNTWPWRRWGPAVLLVLGVVIVYAGSLDGPFIFDDQPVILRNPHTRSLWPIGEALGAPDESAASGRPIVALSLAINYRISAHQPWSYHAFNLLIHVINALLVWSLLARTLERVDLAGARWLALTVALWWAVHPLNSEAVVYVIQRTELLVSMFMLATLWLVVVSADRARPWPWNAAAVVCCVLGVLSKEVMAAAPLLVLLYDRAFLAGSFSAALRQRRALYLGLAGSWVVLAATILTGPRSETVGMDLDLSPLHYLYTQAGVIVMYLKLCFWPAPLVLHYEPPVAQSPMDVLPQALLIAALLALTVWALRRHPRWGFIGAWFFLILAPSSSFVPIVTEVAAERRMYLPALAVLSLVVVGAACLTLRLRRRPMDWRAGALVTAVVAAALGVATIDRVNEFDDPLALWADAVARQPRSQVSRLNYGRMLMEHRMMDEALSEFETARELKPNDPRAHANLGEWWLRRGDPARALEHFERAADLRPDSPGHLADLGDALARTGQFQQSQNVFERALALDPDDVYTHNLIGNTLLRRGDVRGALAEYRQALSIDPGSALVRQNYGAALLRAGQPEQALRELQRAGGLGLDAGEYYGNLGRALLATGRAHEAVDALRTALEKDSGDRDATANLAVALQRVGELDEALALLQHLLELDPDNAGHHNNLGIVYARMGRMDQAVSAFEEALRLDPQHPDARANLEKARRALTDRDAQDGP